MIKKLALVTLLLLHSFHAHAIEVVSSTGLFNVKTSKVLRITGTFEHTMATRAITQIGIEMRRKEPRLVIIDSPGGDTDAGDKIAEALYLEAQATGQPIWCYNAGHAYSMGFNLMSLCHYRLSGQNATFFFHHVGLPGTYFDPKQTYSGSELIEIGRELLIDDLKYSWHNSKTLGITPKRYFELAKGGGSAFKTDPLLKCGWLDDLAVLKE